MTTFEIVSDRFQALLKVDHSTHKRSIGKFLAVDGEYYWSAVRWDRDVLRIPGKCPFDFIDEWDCIHWAQGFAVRNGKMMSNSEKSKLHGFWRNDKLYRIADKNDNLKFHDIRVCQDLINRYKFNWIVWESQSGYWTAVLLDEVGDLQPNFRLSTTSPSFTVRQSDLTADFYQDADEASLRLVSLVSRDVSEIYDHKLDASIRAVSGVNGDLWKKIWVAVVGSPTVLRCGDQAVKLDAGLWVIQHPVPKLYTT